MDFQSKSEHMEYSQAVMLKPFSQQAVDKLTVNFSPEKFSYQIVNDLGGNQDFETKFDFQIKQDKDTFFIYDLVRKNWLVLTPEENLRLVSAKADMKILEELGLSREESKRNIMHLSGGQRQRVAVGRALVAPGRAILADEPTGSLDPKMTDEVIHLLQHAAHQLGKCVIVVTHSKRVANSADVVLRLRSKKLTRA